MLSLRHAVLGFVLLGAAGGTLPAAAAERTVVLSTAERSAIARAFAPVLVFHPLEEYFPTSPVFPLDSSRVLEAAEEHLLDLRTRLGSHSERAAHYRALSIDEKVRRSAVQYRVFSRLVDGRAEVVAEVLVLLRIQPVLGPCTWLPYRVPITILTTWSACIRVATARYRRRPRPPGRGVGDKSISDRASGHKRPRWQHSTESVSGR